MSAYIPSLTIELADLNERISSKSDFRVRLDVEPLVSLIRASQAAHRIYELMLIDRPGDVWDYVWVVLDAIPSRVAERVARARQEAQPKRAEKSHPWPQDRIPFVDFKALFDPEGDDAWPWDEAWQKYQNTDAMRLFARQLLGMARSAQDSLDHGNHLICHITSRIRSSDHPFCYLDRAGALVASRSYRPRPDRHTADFYKTLEGLLWDGNLASVAYRGNGDHRVLLMMAAEQRRRVNLTGHSPGGALHLSAFVSGSINNEDWGSEIWFHDGGLNLGDLFIQGGGIGSGDLQEFVRQDRRAGGRYILSLEDEGDIAGFAKETGDGWTLYTRDAPYNRRSAVQNIASRRHLRVGAILSFADQGATVYEDDKAVVFVGEDVSAAIREALAEIVAEWRRAGGDPVLVVMGDAMPFHLAACESVVAVPAHLADDDEREHWLYWELRRSRRWMDVAIALRAPDWAMRMLETASKHDDGPWGAWVVAAEADPSFNVDHALHGDIEQALRAAHSRAKGKRPMRL